MLGKKVMVVILCALLLFEALAFASVSLGQHKALADEATFYSTASDGQLYGFHDSSYSAAHDLPNAYSLDYGTNRLDIGQFLSPVGFNIYRSALFFDTSSLPDSAVITAATLSLYGFMDASQTDFDITVVNGSLLNDPLVLGDYSYLLNQTISGGAFNTSGFSTSGYNVIPLNTIGMGWISKTGMTQFGLRGSRDITAIAPGAFDDWVVVFSYEEGVGYRPQLNVSYDVGSPVIGITREVNCAILPDVEITLNGTGPVLSDGAGNYEIYAPHGDYTITASKEGFREETGAIHVEEPGPITFNFENVYGLIPCSPDMWYALDCVNLWLYPPAPPPECGLDMWTALDAVNAWLYPGCP